MFHNIRKLSFSWFLRCIYSQRTTFWHDIYFFHWSLEELKKTSLKHYVIHSLLLFTSFAISKDKIIWFQSKLMFQALQWPLTNDLYQLPVEVCPIDNLTGDCFRFLLPARWTFLFFFYFLSDFFQIFFTCSVYISNFMTCPVNISVFLICIMGLLIA